MLFAISYNDSEVINNFSRQQPFQFIKQTVVIKYNIPSALVESQESLSLTPLHAISSISMKSNVQ